MPAKIANIAKNTSYFTLALVGQKIISFSYFIIVARALGPADLGKYYFAISFTTIFAIMIDFGLANVLMREIPKRRAEAERILANILAVKIPLAILTFLLVVLTINLLPYPGLTRQLVYLSAICMVLDSFTLTFFSIIRGFHNLFYESLAVVSYQAVVFIFGLSVLHWHLGLRWLMGAMVAASIFNFSYSLGLLLFRWKLKARPRFELGFLRPLLALAVPFALYAVFQRAYTYLDTVLLSLLAGDKFVGFYQVAFKIIYALQFLPMAFIASLYPAMSYYWARNRGQLAVTFERALSYLMIISAPIAVGVIVLAPQIIAVFKSGFAPAVWPLRLIMASLPFIFLNFPIGALLNACDRQNRNTAHMAVVLAASIGLNLFLIPRYRALGASLTVLLTSSLMFALGIFVSRQIVSWPIFKIIKLFCKIIFAAGLMGLSAYYLSARLNLFLVIALAALVYFLLLFALGGFQAADIKSIYYSLLKKTLV